MVGKKKLDQTDGNSVFLFGVGVGVGGIRMKAVVRV